MPTYIKELPSQEVLKEWLYEKDGKLYWKPRPITKGRWSSKGDREINSWLDNSGYLKCNFKGVEYAVSRLIYQLHYGDLTPDFEVDHENLDKTCNEKHNLRKVPQAVNKRNKPRQTNAASDTTGVCKNVKTNKWGTLVYWVARWYDQQGTLRGRHFRVDILGENEAFRQASEYRAKMIEQLNQQGAGYTVQHGVKQ